MQYICICIFCFLYSYVNYVCIYIYICIYIHYIYIYTYIHTYIAQLIAQMKPSFTNDKLVEKACLESFVFSN